MATRPKSLGPHQARIVKVLSGGLMQRQDLMRRSGLSSSKFSPALRRLKARGVVHVTRGTKTKADGEVFLKGKWPGAGMAVQEQSRGVILSRIYQGRHGAHR